MRETPVRGYPEIMKQFAPGRSTPARWNGAGMGAPSPSRRFHGKGMSLAIGLLYVFVLQADVVKTQDSVRARRGMPTWQVTCSPRLAEPDQQGPGQHTRLIGTSPGAAAKWGCCAERVDLGPAFARQRMATRAGSALSALVGGSSAVSRSVIDHRREGAHQIRLAWHRSLPRRCSTWPLRN
ncbi:MAG TPA: hypothetical protein VLW50_18310 [Streptosporangiaceae bacterium]|nr:hypothetical protein [Streptosporangiaceae bacterium]